MDESTNSRGGQPSPAEHAGTERAEVRILVVDDDEGVRLAVGKFLRRRGYAVDLADGGTAALERLGESSYTLMLCDVRMPGMSGPELLRQALAIEPDLGVLVLSAVNDAATATEVLSLGAMTYLTKPVDLQQLQAAVEQVLYKRDMRIRQREVDHFIRQEAELRTRELEREKDALRRLTVEVTEALIAAMEAKDPYMRGRSYRIGELAASMAHELGLSDEDVESVRLAGRLHDVGTIGVREAVLGKPGPLSPEELAHVREHVRIGVEILAPLSHLGAVLEFVHDHHERFDGSGYPRGLAGEAISLGGRIIAVADAYDAVTSGRAYREALPPARALEYLQGQAGSLLDPRVYDALRTVVERRRSLTFINAMQD
jgi:response regulator RpfG family c-di-GMP phosphodiesterase